MGNPPPSVAYPKNAERRRAVIARNAAYVQSRIYALEEAQAAQLGRMLEQARDKMGAALVRAMTQHGGTWAYDSNYRQRTDALMQQIGVVLNDLIRDAQDSTLGAMVGGYRGAYYGRAWLIDDALRNNNPINLPLLPETAIRAALLAPYGGSTFLDRFTNARDQFVTLIRQSIVQSQINGDSIPDAIKRLSEALGINVGRGGAERGLRARLEMIARTEILRASNAGAMAIYEANQDVLKGWEFQATNDERTCDECGPLDGKQFAFDDDQDKPPLHPNCRCAAEPVLIDSALEDKIVGPHQTWSEWKAQQMIYDTGAMD